MKLQKYRVFQVEGGYEVYYCPSAPLHYNDCIPFDKRVHSKKQAAYRKAKQLNERIEAEQKQKEESVA